MKNFKEISCEGLLAIFDKRNQLTWPELLQFIFKEEVSMFKKSAVAEIIEILQKENCIERVKGETTQWRITEVGRYRLINSDIDNSEDGHSFGLLGQTPN
jgi:hypothetical protein